MFKVLKSLLLCESMNRACHEISQFEKKKKLGHTKCEDMPNSSKLHRSANVPFFIRSTIACSDNPQTLRILPIEITQVSEDLQLKIGQDCIFE